jgi:hypothetical protein
MTLDESVRRDLIAQKYAFIDAGCRTGGSVNFCQMRFGGIGLGLDWHESELEIARRDGYAAAQCDIRFVELPPKCVRFVSMMDFLEHLPDEATGRLVLEKLAGAARDFLFIRHPSFDDIEYLKGFGLKLGWTDWKDHPNMWRIGDLRRIFEELGWRDYRIHEDLPIHDSGHPGIVPLGSPPDTCEYDEAAHGPKPQVAFDRVLYGKYDIFVRLNPKLPDEEWETITRMEGWRAAWVSGTW